MADGHLQADFAVRRIGFNLCGLPGAPPVPVEAVSDPMPAKDAGRSAGAEGDAAAGIRGT